MMSLWDALRMNMMISYQELVRTFPKPGPHNTVDASPLCEKHCMPDQGQKDPAQPQLVALPAAITLTLNTPECDAVSHYAWSVTLPAAGPPATIRYCRFRE